jgi:hypothetical protein
MRVSEVVNNTAIVRLSDTDVYDIREDLLELMESIPEDKSNLHKQGGLWELAGRLVGWPLGFQAEAGWVDFDEWEQEVEV